MLTSSNSHSESISRTETLSESCDGSLPVSGEGLVVCGKESDVLGEFRRNIRIGPAGVYDEQGAMVDESLNLFWDHFFETLN